MTDTKKPETTNSRQQNHKKVDSIITEINQKEVEKQLLLLGYKKGDTVFLRGFLPSDHPNKSTDKGRKAAVKNINQLIKTTTEWQAQGLGVYLVVNGGGHTDNDVLSCRAIFYEHDNLDKEAQSVLWQSLNLPTPTFQVDTGGKSIHSYWVLDEYTNSQVWRKLQTDLLEYADADRSLKNPSRVMRLAGCFHSSGQQSKIISESGNTYSFVELRDLIPGLEQKKTKPPITFNFSADEIPLYQCLTKEDRSLIDSGAGEGGRNSSGAKLARNLIGTAERLNYLGHKFTNDPRSLFDDYCSRCSPPLASKESDLIWRSALKDNPTPSLTDDALENCVKAWQRQQQQGIGNSQQPSSKPKTPKTELITELSQLVDKELPKSQLEILFSEIAEQHGRAASEIRRIYEALCKEKNFEESRLEVKTQIPEIFKAQQARLDPKQLFWGDGGRFADLLQKVADAMPTSVENLITTLIPVAGSRMGTAARIVINPTARYTQPSIFWSCVVAPTGRLKTPAQEVIISPLAKLEADEFRKWQYAKEDFEEELKRYKKNSEESPPEQPAPRKRFLVQAATAETRIKLHSENPRGLLNYRDEWSSFINGRNKYRNGKGDDLELDLSEFNGNAILKDNANDSLFIERSAISRTGNTQPETLQKFLAAQDYEDYTGEFARWLFCLVPGEVAFIELFKDQDNSGELLDESLTDLYRQIGKLPEKDYFLTDGAKGVFQSHHRWMTEAEINEPHPGLRAAYPKLKSYLARLCLWLHIVNAVLAGQEPSQIIEGSTMFVASSLVNFFLNQATLLYNSFGSGDAQESHLTGELLKIKEYIEKHPEGCTIRDIKYGVYCLRKCPKAEVEANCRSLLELKIVKIEDKKYFLLGKKDHQIITFSESPTAQSFEGDDQRSSKIIKDHHFLENSPHPTELNINSVETSKKSNTQDDHDDLLMIPDHHPQTQTEKQFRGSDDHDDLFLEEIEKNNQKTDNTTEVVRDPEIVSEDMTYDPAANAELLREALHDESWEMITELTEEWTAKFKKQVWGFLSQREQEAIRDMKPVQTDKIPVFMTKDVYLSESLKSKVVVHTIYDNDQECGCTIVGKKGIYSLKFHDLKFAPESPYIECKPLDKVKILYGKHNGVNGVVTSVMPGGPIFVRSEQTGKSLGKPYFAHQLVKL